MDEKKNLKSVSEYGTYRGFLNDLYVAEKKSEKRSTLKRFSAKFKMTASGLQMVLSSKRNLTLEQAHRIASALKMNDLDRAFFEALVLRDQVGDPLAKRYYSRRLKEIGSRMPVQTKRLSSRRLVMDWITPAVLIYLIDFSTLRGDGVILEEAELLQMARRLGISPEKIRGTVRFLQEEGLLTVTPENQVHFVFDRIANHINQREYFKASVQALASRIEKHFERGDNLMRSLTFSMSVEHLPDFRSEMLALFEKYMAKYDPARSGNSIFQAVIGIYPLFND